MAKIFWDTNLFIYLFEDYGRLGEQAALLRNSAIERGDRIFTSAMTLGEMLVHPVANGLTEVQARYRQFFREPNVTVLPFDLNAAESYARVRQQKGIQPADAIQLACAAAANIDLFITNDERLSKRYIPGINFITSLRKAPL